MKDITWGTDGNGTQYYLCRYCEIEFGTEPTEHHECDKSKPMYHNRGKKEEDEM